ncbi:MAG: LysE/ArgO family amino acid transporter [Rhodospirillaceae bacterium]|nr:LysE/ArgO family amino acid transporter [Rhodospirillaceae bacterium]
MLVAYSAGLFLCFGLIVAIGAQNAFVLRQGLRGEHVLPVCLVCAGSDAILVAAGVAGLGYLTTKIPGLEIVARYGGAAFLLAYAVLRLRSALKGQAGLAPDRNQQGSGLGQTLGVCLLFTWANPHVYLDSVILVGSVSTRYAGQEIAFALGAISASFLFFFALGYGAALLRPLFARPLSWRILDGAIALLMTMIGLSLIPWPTIE